MPVDTNEIITRRRKPWERRSDESEVAYRMFRHYLQTQPVTARSVLNSYRAIYGRPEVVAPPGFVSAWCAQYKWRDRCRQFDNELSRQETQAIIRAAAAKAAAWANRREQIAEDDFNDGLALRAKVREMLNFPTFRQTITREEEAPDGRTVIQHITIEPVDFTFAQAGQMLKLASERQRLAADMATQIVENVTPASQQASRLAEARVVLDEARDRFPTMNIDTLARQVAATFGVEVDQLLEMDAGAEMGNGEYDVPADLEGERLPDDGDAEPMQLEAGTPELEPEMEEPAAGN